MKPDIIKKLSTKNTNKVKELHLGNGRMKEFPHQLSRFNNLKNLNLHNNNLMWPGLFTNKNNGLARVSFSSGLDCFVCCMHLANWKVIYDGMLNC